jgi:hypothetical protein
MATRLQITCISKSDSDKPEEMITAVGGYKWKHSMEEAIKNIESGEVEYYVHVSFYQVDVTISMLNGKKYLRTKYDGDLPENLLGLKNCL